jgi:hypothetical protein
MRNKELRKSKGFVVGLLASLVLVLVGCRTNQPLEADGLPGEEYLVGGGVMIDWEAPTTGTAYLVEKTSGKIVETRSLNEGDSYTFTVTSGGRAGDFEKMLGVKFGEARFLLYFRPEGAVDSRF